MKDTLVCSIVGLAKFLLAGLVTLLFRAITPLLGLSNVSPLLATQLAGAKAYGPLIGALYGSLGMIALDYFMRAVGVWTVYTSLTYGLVGYIAGIYMRGKNADITLFVKVSIAGTLVFDLVTGILMSPLHGTDLYTASIGQIPFTAKHLAGNVFFALFAPWFYRNIIGNPVIELRYIFRETNVRINS